MKQNILIIAIILCYITSIKAQTFSISQLKNVNWTAEEKEGNINTIKFSCTEYYHTMTFFFSKQTRTVKYPYYLSASKPAKFDSSLVGKNTKGKYVVINAKKDILCVFELKEVTKNKIVALFGDEVIYTFYKK